MTATYHLQKLLIKQGVKMFKKHPKKDSRQTELAKWTKVTFDLSAYTQRSTCTTNQILERTHPSIRGRSHDILRKHGLFKKALTAKRLQCMMVHPDTENSNVSLCVVPLVDFEMLFFYFIVPLQTKARSACLLTCVLKIQVSALLLI